MNIVPMYYNTMSMKYPIWNLINKAKLMDQPTHDNLRKILRAIGVPAGLSNQGLNYGCLEERVVLYK